MTDDDRLEGENVEKDSSEMPFLDHLEELRMRIIRSLIALFIAAIGAYTLSGHLLSVLVRAAGDLQAISPLETFTVRIKIAVVAGLVVALPIILYQAWRFIAPGLLGKEKRVASGLLFSATACFVIGGVFSFLYVGPMALRFLEGFATPEIKNVWSVSRYVSFILRLMLAFGIVFELPVAIFFLSKIGVVTPRLLRRKRRYAIVLIFLLAATLTPPDVFTQLMLAAPLILLYEVGILVSAAAQPKRRSS